MNRRGPPDVESGMKKIAILGLAAVVLAGCTAFGIRSGYEGPAYEVIESPGEAFEIRRYAPRVAAESSVEGGDTEDARNAAFRLLFDYITGANRADAEIAMTTPVETADSGEKIAMAVPVETRDSDSDGRLRIRFFLPAIYDAESAPAPTDPRVNLVTLPAQTLAGLRFSGSRSEERIDAKTDELLVSLRGTAWRPTAAPVAQLYDPPWTLPFFRRNEVAVSVTQ